MTPFIKCFITTKQHDKLNGGATANSVLPKDSEINQYFTNLSIDARGVFLLRQMVIVKYMEQIVQRRDPSTEVFYAWLVHQLNILISFTNHQKDDTTKMHAYQTASLAIALNRGQQVDIDLLSQYEVGYDNIPGMLPSDTYLPFIKKHNIDCSAKNITTNDFSMIDARLLVPASDISSRIRIMYTQDIGDCFIPGNPELRREKWGILPYFILSKSITLYDMLLFLSRYRTEIPYGIAALAYNCVVESNTINIKGKSPLYTGTTHYDMNTHCVITFTNLLKGWIEHNPTFLRPNNTALLFIRRLQSISLPPPVADLLSAVAEKLSHAVDEMQESVDKTMYSAIENLQPVAGLRFNTTRTLSVDTTQPVLAPIMPCDLVLEIDEWLENRRLAEITTSQGTEDEGSSDDADDADDVDIEEDDGQDDDTTIKDDDADPLSEDEGSDEDDEDAASDDGDVNQDDEPTEEGETPSHVAKTVSKLLGVDYVLEKTATINSVMIKRLLEFQIDEILREQEPPLSPDEQQALRYFKLYWLHLVDVDTAVAVIERILAGKKLPMIRNINRKKV